MQNNVENKSNSTMDSAEKLAACEKLRDEYLEGWKRAKADLANYKKEEAERIQSVISFSNETLIRELLSVLDSFALGTAALTETDKALHGMRLIEAQFLDILGRFGVKKIHAKRGAVFDPAIHEASSVAVSDVSPECIVEEISCGYALHSKVLRPARVIVSKGHAT